MGPRKGGGRSAFVRSARAKPGADDDEPNSDPSTVEESVASESVQQPVSKAAAFLKVPEPTGSEEDGSSGDDGGGDGTETRGQVLQRHKRVSATAACRPPPSDLFD